MKLKLTKEEIEQVVEALRFTAFKEKDGAKGLKLMQLAEKIWKQAKGEA